MNRLFSLTRLSLLTLLFAAHLVLPCSAAPGPVAVHWSETTGAFADRTVIVVTRVGERLAGSWLCVQPDGVQFYVRNKTRSARYPKGLIYLARSDIRYIHLEHRRVRARAILTPLAILYSAGIAMQANSAAAPAVFVGGSLAGLIGGYILDHRPTHVILLPD